MKTRTTAILSSTFILMTAVLWANAAAAQSKHVTLLRTPEGGIQPQAVTDNKGGVHLIYYKGAPAGGDIFYTREEPGQDTFAKPVRVNRQPGSAIATGTIRGAQLAAGKNGRIHVVWNGGKGSDRVPIEGKQATPLLYARMNDAGTGFEPERNLITYAAGLDGGSSVAADPAGSVYVTWHAHPPGNTNREAGRAVFVARSSDEGKTFGREERATSRPTGACACCGMKALADSSGAVYILYRAATASNDRDEMLLVSHGAGADFEIADTHRWKIATCPMSSFSMAEAKDRILAAWETAGQIYWATIDPRTMLVSKPIAPPLGIDRKHPVAVGNSAGETLLVWTEGTGWEKGGAVVWQLYDKEGKATSEKGRERGVPVWSLASAFAKANGDFVIVY